MPEGGWEQLVIWLLLGVLPWIFVVAGAAFLFRAHRFMSGATRIKGSVTAVHSSISRKNDGRIVTAYRPVFQFSDADGRSREAETYLTSTSYDFEIGSKHEILFNPAEPEKVRMPGFMIYGFGAIFLLGGLAFGIVGILALLQL